MEAKLFDGVFGGYWTGIRRRGKKIESKEVLDFHKNLKNLIVFYLFTKPPNQDGIKPRKTRQTL
jgi:hypothetical protein